MRSVAVVGAGWAGLAAAVRLQDAGCAVTVFEASSSPGGRARTVIHQGRTLDNGQHILIGAYTQTLALMRHVGVDPDEVIHRRPLTLVDPHGVGFRCPAGPALPSLVWGFLRQSHWPIATRIAWIARTARWMWQGMRCPPDQSVSELCAGLPAQVIEEWIDPLCVAALNTDSREASATVFLRVLRDALLGGRGSADLLLPRQPLGRLLPEAAVRRLQGHGATMRWRHRVQPFSAAASAGEGEGHDAGWRIDGQAFEAVVLACPAWEAARLTEVAAPGWSVIAAGMRHEPIITVVLEAGSDASLAAPMVRLGAGPAQFAFDLAAFDHSLGTLRCVEGSVRKHFAFVISAAGDVLAQGGETIDQAVLNQAREACPLLESDPALRVVARFTEKRATFRCTAGLTRPAADIAPGLHAAGDYVDGPYPATLEGAVRSGEDAARAILSGR